MKAPLRTVLKNFLDHVTDLEARKKLSDDQYETEFQELKKLTEKLKEDAAYPCSNGLKDVNRPKNRYKDIVPYDFSRVILPKYEGIPGSDYINASYVKGASGAFAYIAAQGPLPNTVIDFWRMIWICDVQVLVMACNEQEAGKFKCEAYWPQNGEVGTYGNISVELIKVSQVCPDFLVRTLLVKCDSEMRDVYQFHYTSWPDHGIPDTVQPILDLVRLMRECQASETIPILVHCSAGCGRTGTLCAVDYVWACLRHGKLDEDFSLFNIAMELRRQRIAMIQTKEQYILAHKVVATMFEQQLKVIDCHTYENLDEDGEPLMWKEITKGNEFHFKKENSNVIEPVKSSAKIKELENDIVPPKCPNEVHVLANDSLKAHNVSTQNSSPEKMSMTDSVNDVSKTSESSYSRNSYLSQQSNEDNIPFIDDDDVCIRPNCGRAYLDIPSCDSISKLMNCFDPFVDKVSLGTDDSSPDGDSNSFNKKLLDFNSSSVNKTHANELKASSPEVNKQDLTLRYGNSDIDAPSYTRSGKNILLSSRESYPPSSLRSEKITEELMHDLQESKSEETCDNMKSLKKIGKATVVRRPSISKLKALFEKSGISSNKVCSDTSKRPLFRHNSHHVSRAGSAPPSLNCMDNTAAVERESILMMVTRKFRSSSVRTEREVISKQSDKSLNRKSTTGLNFKEGLSTLSRAVSFNLNKTFRNYSPTKSKTDKTSSKTPVLNSDEPVHVEICKTKSSETKPNSTWYDKSSLPRAVAIVRPTEKLNSTPSSLSISSKNDVKQSTDKCKNEDCINKPPKLFPFFGSLNKSDAKNVSTMWYGDESAHADSEAEKNISNNSNDSNTKTFVKSSTNKVLPLSLPSFSQLKKIVPKSPLSSPESPKNSKIQDQPNLEIPNSKFYMEVKDSCNQPIVDVCTCPIPEEIIIISGDSKDKNNFWPSNVMPSSKNYTCESPKESKLIENNSVKRDISLPSEVSVKEIAKIEIDDDIRPAIPKKQVIGKNKKFLFDSLTDRKEVNQHQKCEYTKEEPILSSESKQEVKSHAAQEKCDLYTNVNIKAMKNIEQIENTLRKNPRAAIIDLTSRDSYSMEEELVNAVKQLSEPTEDDKMISSKNTLCTGNKITASKSTSKFPGYEVIWPEEKYSNTSSIPSQQESSKLTSKSKILSCDKTGVCYSPPLRRSVNTTLALAKSQSCGNLDWLESDDSKEQPASPTKMLVNEAVVELNTLLNQLTSKTLSEDPDIKSNNERSFSAADEQSVKQNMPKCKVANVKQNDLENSAIHSVTLVTKSYASGDSPKEEEIVFHFPPPPRMPPPPPEEEPPSESFNILCKNGALVVSETNKNLTSHEVPNKEFDPNLSDNIAQNFPQPAPRRSKQANELQRSASFSMLCPMKYKNRGYENVFNEKYQTLSRLEVKPPSLKLNEQNVETTVPKDNLFQEYKKLKGKSVSNYVNVKDVKSCNSSYKIALNSETLHLQNTSNKNSLSHFRPLDGNLISGEKEESFSHYGKILKLSEREMKEHSSSVLTNDIDDIRKKMIPSKKSERAPLPPNIKQITRKSDEKYPSKLDSAAVISKKLPSRKHEKAPLPPPLLQKCSSAASVPQKSIKDFQYSVKYPTLHIANEDHKLPAVHENIPNTTDCLNIKDSKKNNAFKGNKFGRGLSHSQSDVSVFLTLKENRAQLNQGLKTANNKPFMNKVLKQGKNFASESSSDSDSSYEHIVLINSNDKHPDISRKHLKEQREVLPSVRSYKKEVPVAPPRSKRRGTTEVQYAKVKTKEASLTLSGSERKELPEDYQKSFKQEMSNKQEVPPAVPVKTKGAFEIPEEFYIKDVNKIVKPESG